MDSIFGTFSSDDLKLVNHRAVRSGVQHRHHITPLDPRPGDAVTVHVVTAGDAAFDQAALFYTTDGRTPSGSRGAADNGTAIQFERAGLEWDALIWEYLIHWQAVIPGQPDQTMVQYVISAWTEGGDEVFADRPNAEDRVQQETMRHFKSIAEEAVLVPMDRFARQEIFNYQVDIVKPPQWAHEAIIYHIFVDRFYPGEGKKWRQTADLRDYYGGTLWGVADKLDYVADLGVNCIWLSPTWASPSYHGYDVTDYERVETRMGGDAALHAVVEGAHERGMRVLLDMVCNHLSSQHPIFVDAFKNERSPYRDWFFFDDGFEHGYKSFLNVPSMPILNLAFPAARDWMVANGVYWLREFDVDGYRLDVADGPGPNFWPYFQRACKAIKPDCLIFGEIVDTPQRLRTYAGRLDGCLDFPLNDALRRTFGWEKMTESQLQAFVDNNGAYYPDDYVAPSFLDNHDMDRFYSIAGNDAEKLKKAASLQMQLRNPPIIYYGNEVGLQQTDSLANEGFDVSRTKMLWGVEQNRDLLSFYQQKIQARKQRRVAGSEG